MEREFPPPPRAGLQGSPLLDLLAQLALAERPAAPPCFVEGLGRWLGWKEAIPLSAVLQPATRAAAAVRAPAARKATTWEHEFKHVHTTLRRAIVEDMSTAHEDGLSYLPFRRSFFQQQQAMETAIGPLRTQLRAAMARLSPALARLAALDAVMATALAPREQAQLALLPVLLEQHFSRLRQATDADTTDTPWLSRFRHDMQQLLLAELDLRLQPAQGLLATLRGQHQGPEGHHA